MSNLTVSCKCCCWMVWFQEKIKMSLFSSSDVKSILAHRHVYYFFERHSSECFFFVAVWFFSRDYCCFLLCDARGFLVHGFLFLTERSKNIFWLTFSLFFARAALQSSHVGSQDSCSADKCFVISVWLSVLCVWDCRIFLIASLVVIFYETTSSLSHFVH